MKRIALTLLLIFLLTGSVLSDNVKTVEVLPYTHNDGVQWLVFKNNINYNYYCRVTDNYGNLIYQFHLPAFKVKYYRRPGVDWLWRCT